MSQVGSGDKSLVRLIDDAQRCPHCPDQGWYSDLDRHTGDPVQVQCEFCCTVPDSLFNVHERVKAALSATRDTDRDAIYNADCNDVLEVITKMHNSPRFSVLPKYYAGFFKLKEMARIATNYCDVDHVALYNEMNDDERELNYPIARGDMS